MNGFQVYREYLALKLHFTKEGYTYAGPRTASNSSFVNRRDRYHFEKLAKHRDPKGVIIASLLSNQRAWIGDIAGEAGEREYTEYLKRRQSLTYRFSGDIKSLHESFNANFLVRDGHPKLLELYLAKQINLETICILLDCTSALAYWDLKMADDPVWQAERLLIVKYLPFLDYDKKMMKAVVLKHFQH